MLCFTLYTQYSWATFKLQVKVFSVPFQENCSQVNVTYCALKLHQNTKRSIIMACSRKFGAGQVRITPYIHRKLVTRSSWAAIPVFCFVLSLFFSQLNHKWSRAPRCLHHGWWIGLVVALVYLLLSLSSLLELVSWGRLSLTAAVSLCCRWEREINNLSMGVWPSKYGQGLSSLPPSPPNCFVFKL